MTIVAAERLHNRQYSRDLTAADELQAAKILRPSYFIPSDTMKC